MRAFVVGTGRCGTSTCYQALKHAKNYTVGHESEAGRIPTYIFPDNHIEVSAQLVIAIPKLMELYPEAKWIHLFREKDSCCKSLMENCSKSMQSFAKQWFLIPFEKEIDIEIAECFYGAVNSLCSSLLPSDSPQLKLETIDYNKWRYCWEYLECKGDFEASYLEWSRHYNSSKLRGKDKWMKKF